MRSKDGRGPEIVIPVTQLPHAEGLTLPAYQSEAAAGLDLTAAVPAGKPIRLARGAWAMIPTGLILELPAGFEGQVRPRSGLAARQGVTVLNSPGTIDSDYRGEVQVILINLGRETATIARGDRIAQLIVAPVRRARLVAAKTVSRTARGTGGFGSTGVATLPRSVPAKARRNGGPVSKPAMPKSKEVVRKALTRKSVARKDAGKARKRRT